MSFMKGEHHLQDLAVRSTSKRTVLVTCTGDLHVNVQPAMVRRVCKVHFLYTKPTTTNAKCRSQVDS